MLESVTPRIMSPAARAGRCGSGAKVRRLSFGMIGDAVLRSHVFEASAESRGIGAYLPLIHALAVRGTHLEIRWTLPIIADEGVTA